MSQRMMVRKVSISLQGEKDIYLGNEACYNQLQHLNKSRQLQVLVNNLAEEATRQHRAPLVISISRYISIQTSPFTNHLHTPRQSPNQNQLLPSIQFDSQSIYTYSPFLSFFSFSNWSLFTFILES